MKCQYCNNEEFEAEETLYHPLMIRGNKAIVKGDANEGGIRIICASCMSPIPENTDLELEIQYE